MVSKTGGTKAQKTTTPDDQQPNTTPLEAFNQHSFLLQTMLELQRSFGKVEAAVETLQTKVGDQSKKLESLQRIVWISTGVLTVLSVLAGLVIRNNYDRIMQFISTTPPAASSPANLPSEGSPANN